MRKDYIILLLILIPAAIFITFVAKNRVPQKISNPFAMTTPFPTISRPSSEEITHESITPAASQNIEVLAPFMGDNVKSGFIVKGNARTFENNVAIRLLDSNGNILIETFTTANAPDMGQFGPFEKSINFSTDDTSGKLEVFQYSAKDGSEIDKVEIPVIFIKN